MYTVLVHLCRNVRSILHGIDFYIVQSINLPYLNIKFSIMLRWSISFLIIALIAALFGFGGVASGMASLAKLLFFVFVALKILNFIGFDQIN